MMFFKRWFPAVACTVTVINLMSCYDADNMPAVYANISALMAWMILAMDEYYNAKAAHRASDPT